ncbi:MAG: tyrosine-type recombinase/integrase [Eubacteriales bacterium]|nr:tyrosine-type recombinase/integrase [Eubacteriales bacterium]
MYQQLENFILYFELEKLKSKNTLLSYHRDVRQMLDWLFADSRISSVSEISPLDLKKYMEYMENIGKSAATISRSLAAIKAFFSYLLIKKEIVSDPSVELKAPKVFKKKTEEVKDSDITKILMQPSEKTSKGIRDKAMLELMCDTGMRASDIIRLNLDDVNLKNRTVTIRSESESGESVTYHRNIQKYLTRYLTEARAELISINSSKYFFVNCQGKEFTRQGFWKLVKKYGKQAGIEKDITPHMMSHNRQVYFQNCVNEK